MKTMSQKCIAWAGSMFRPHIKWLRPNQLIYVYQLLQKHGKNDPLFVCKKMQTRDYRMDIPQQFEVQTIIWEVLCSTKISLRCRTSPKKSYVFKLVELFFIFLWASFHGWRHHFGCVMWSVGWIKGSDLLKVSGTH